jgi:hypothetical protein
VDEERRSSTKITETELIKKVDLLKSAGFSNRDLGLYIMGGLKEQMPDDMLTEMNYIGSLGVKVKPVFISPVPQTILFEYYAQQFPLLRLDPLWQNDSFFITCLKGWDHAAIESVRVKAKDINSKIGLNISRRTDIHMERPLPLTRNSNSKVNQGELLQNQAEITTNA